jgi:hypothetical protein
MRSSAASWRRSWPSPRMRSRRASSLTGSASTTRSASSSVRADRLLERACDLRRLRPVSCPGFCVRGRARQQRARGRFAAAAAGNGVLHLRPRGLDRARRRARPPDRARGAKASARREPPSSSLPIVALTLWLAWQPDALNRQQSPLDEPTRLRASLCAPAPRIGGSGRSGRPPSSRAPSGVRMSAAVPTRSEPNYEPPKMVPIFPSRPIELVLPAPYRFTSAGTWLILC